MEPVEYIATAFVESANKPTDVNVTPEARERWTEKFRAADTAIRGHGE